MQRNSDDLCLLCQKNQANDKGSHLVPAGMLNTNVGKRGYEESFRIILEKPSIDQFFGQSNLKNTNPEIKPHHYTRDHWFCKDCENRMAVVESIVQPILLRDLNNESKSQNFQVSQTSIGNTFKQIKRLKPQVFQLFFLSVLWRMALNNRLDSNQEAAISQVQEEELRITLNKHLKHKLKEYKGELSPILHNFIVLTANGATLYGVTNEEELNNNFVVALNKGIYENPSIFFINEFVVFYYPSGLSMKPINDIRGDYELINCDSEIPKIAYVSDQMWEQMQFDIASKAARQIMQTLVSELMAASGHTDEYCRQLIFQSANKIQGDFTYVEKCQLATRILVEKFDNIK